VSLEVPLDQMTAPVSTNIRRWRSLPTAERSLLIMLIGFAVSVIATRWFLALAGYPKIGGGDLHIAHALWGGGLLFVGSLLPIVWTGHRVHDLAAALSGVGMGLFIDEVGKFITTRNDYFYPAAAPIIYSTFLLSSLLSGFAAASAQPGARRRMWPRCLPPRLTVRTLRPRGGCRGRDGGDAPARHGSVVAGSAR
jgi:hypothetical protein